MGEPAETVGWTRGEADETGAGLVGREVGRQTPGQAGGLAEEASLDLGRV